ncbi:hypothetical protein OTU49_004098 [Cherax quadricarinatus]|uniref:Uncharacterized protein n=1 Tax=Cherax quadricarinatus TaxID=27406 RepID=A0AAW0X0Z0_CHEQU
MRMRSKYILNIVWNFRSMQNKCYSMWETRTKICSVYLSIHRKTFTFLRCNIFDEVHPNKKYPVYFLSIGKQKTVRRVRITFSRELSDADFNADSSSGKTTIFRRLMSL